VHFKLPKDKLWATVYAEDDEAYDIWLKDIGLPAERIVRIGDNKGGRYMSDNFWMMGDTGPCGPCSEIFYDHGPDVAGGPPGSPEQDGDRYIEIWNNVFMQFNRTEDGVMHRCPSPAWTPAWAWSAWPRCCSTCTATTRSTCSCTCWRGQERGGVCRRRCTGGATPRRPSLKVIADHIRACAFTVADGVIPGNEGRGYVLRRIARRAIRHGYKLGARKPFFHTLVAPLAGRDGRGLPRAAARDGARDRGAEGRRRSASSRPSPTAWRSWKALLAQRRRWSTARPPSSCTTPSASRST
jgi:alanyl-tRNA synthetase